MRYKKIYDSVMINYIDSYGLISERIRTLEEKKEEGISKDINSYIKSKNKVSRGVENIVINNILIDDNINTLKKWKSIIDKVYSEFKGEEKNKGDILYYKLYTSFSIEIISGLCNSSVKRVYRILKDFVTEIILIAIDENLIDIKEVEP